MQLAELRKRTLSQLCQLSMSWSPFWMLRWWRGSIYILLSCVSAFGQTLLLWYYIILICPDEEDDEYNFSHPQLGRNFIILGDLFGWPKTNSVWSLTCTYVSPTQRSPLGKGPSSVYEAPALLKYYPIWKSNSYLNHAQFMSSIHNSTIYILFLRTPPNVSIVNQWNWHRI